MPAPLTAVSMSIEEFERMPHRLGWKHEYWDGKARLSPSSTAITALRRSTVTDDFIAVPSIEIRSAQASDRPDLTELFLAAFDDNVEYTGYPTDAYRKEAERNVGGPLEHSFVAIAEQQLIGAILMRQQRSHWLIQPIMVLPLHHRRGVAGGLLNIATRSLHDAGIEQICSRCHLANEASMVWHQKHGFEETMTTFAAQHRRHHFQWMREHYRSIGNHQAADEANRQEEYWWQVLQEIEQSDRRYEIDPF